MPGLWPQLTSCFHCFDESVGSRPVEPSRPHKILDEWLDLRLSLGGICESPGELLGMLL
jgi:hypothetical protein